MLKKLAALVTVLLGLAWLVYIWGAYVSTPAEALSYLGWVFIYSILWTYSILLRAREMEEAQNKARVVSVIIFIPILAYLVARLLGHDFPMIEMAAAIAIFGLFLSWAYRLYK